MHKKKRFQKKNGIIGMMINQNFLNQIKTKINKNKKMSNRKVTSK